MMLCRKPKYRVPFFARCINHRQVPLRDMMLCRKPKYHVPFFLEAHEAAASEAYATYVATRRGECNKADWPFSPAPPTCRPVKRAEMRGA